MEFTSVENHINPYLKNIAFFVRHFTERGTEVAIYDYAKYNEELLKNKSYIVCFTDEKQKQMENKGFPTVKHSYQKFNNRFEIIKINEIEQMKDVIKAYNLHFFYTMTYGGYGDIYKFENKSIWGDCKTIKHCVFNFDGYESDFYLGIGNCLNHNYNTNYPIIPYIVDLPDCNENMRKVLNIPDDAIVFGRYGGDVEFNIVFVYEAIAEFLHTSTNRYFLFMGTRPFYNHPRIIYLEKNVDLMYKTRFINTCDAMIHARTMGETFGLAVAEFSLKNKPVITSLMGDLEHINILKEKAIVYSDKNSLINIFRNIKTIKGTREDWNAYKDYNPAKIMSKFNKIFTEGVENK